MSDLSGEARKLIHSPAYTAAMEAMRERLIRRLLACSSMDMDRLHCSKQDLEALERLDHELRALAETHDG